MNELTGTRELLRLALRRDRLLLPIWVYVFVLVAVGSAKAGLDLYPNLHERVAAATAANATTALVALYGRIYHPAGLGGIAMLKLTVLGCVFMGLLSTLLVTRHTRAEEEQGRVELLGAGVVGRYAPLAAALALAVGTSVLIGLLTGAGLRIAGMPVGGSLAFAVAWTTCGIAFAGVSAVSAQLTQTARTANGLAVGVLGAAYLLRAIGDTALPALSYLSPIGWSQQIRPYGGDRFWLGLLPLGLAVCLGFLAFALVARRDLGSGLLPDRRGPARAAVRLRSAAALSWRLQRGQLAGWLVTFAVLGVVLGSLSGNLHGLADGAASRQLIIRLGGVSGLRDAFLSTELSFMALAATAYGLVAAGRMRSEEAQGRAELVLAGAVTRPRWVGGHVAIALAGSALSMLAGGLGATIGSGRPVGTLVGASLVRLPAVWVVTGIAVLGFGLAPRLTVVGWATLVVFLLLGQLGDLLKLSQAVQRLSPYAHVPDLPGGALRWTPLLALTALAVVLVTAGVVGFRRRDLAAH